MEIINRCEVCGKGFVGYSIYMPKNNYIFVAGNATKYMLK